MKLQTFIATHTPKYPFKSIPIDDIWWVQGGARLEDRFENNLVLRDDTGIHCSELNGLLNEWTILYWIVNNIAEEEQWIAFHQYRRFFDYSKINGSYQKHTKPIHMDLDMIHSILKNNILEFENGENDILCSWRKHRGTWLDRTSKWVGYSFNNIMEEEIIGDGDPFVLDLLQQYYDSIDYHHCFSMFQMPFSQIKDWVLRVHPILIQLLEHKDELIKQFGWVEMSDMWKHRLVGIYAEKMIGSLLYSLQTTHCPFIEMKLTNGNRRQTHRATYERIY